jgi:hypothetical protein
MNDRGTDFDPDLFVAWLAEVGEGRIDQLQEALCWAADVDRKAANRWLSDLDRLGHCEIDWPNRTWSARPLRVTPLPGPVECSLVLGTRPHPRLADDLDGFVASKHPGETAGIPLPATLWYEGSEKEAGEILGAEPISCEAARVAGDLRPLSPGRPTPGPGRNTKLSPFDPRTLRFRWPRPAGVWPDGLYRYEASGRWHFVLRRDLQWYEVELRAGVYLATSASQTPVAWRPESEDRSDDLALGRLAVKAAAPLPPDHDYAAIACTGLPPLLLDDQVVYDGVPLWIARRIAVSLHRELEIL